MFIKSGQVHEMKARLQALNNSQAVIEFNMDGIILTANPIFLKTMGYDLNEIQGQHHSIFVEPADKTSLNYQQFWENLRSGQYQSGEYKRLDKNGQEVWLQAFYNPLLDKKGRPFKLIKYASDITPQIKIRMRNETVKKVIDENLEKIESAISNASQQSSSVASASTQTSSSVQAVAAGAEELSTSVREIAESMAKSKFSVDKAYQQANTANQATRQLASAAEAMGGIVSLIRTIASQINLLALNATIESARAGEAGRGFAVVANEVKNLAKQAANATEQISHEIEGMQTAAGNVVDLLNAIKQSVEAVREYTISTANAVEEQSAVTIEISNNMQSAAEAVANISQSVSEIAISTQNADNSTKHLKQAAISLVMAA